MKLFLSEQIRQIDEATIQNEPIASIDLVERASQACTAWILENYEGQSSYHIFCGMGNNGADGLAIARLLAESGQEVSVHVIAHRSKGSSNFDQNIKRLAEVGIDANYVNNPKDMPVVHEDSIAIDAILGIGLDKPLRGILKEVVQSLGEAYEHIISIDVPTGLPSDLVQDFNSKTVVKAVHTLTFQFPKLSFLLAETGEVTGEIHVLDIGLDGVAIHDTPSKFHITTEFEAETFRPTRKSFSHKGTFGHAFLVSGHDGMMGAAVLATRACLRSGAGWVTTHVPKSGRDVLQMTAPEAMVSVDHDSSAFTGATLTDRYSAIGIGPGLGRETKSLEALKKVLSEVQVPVVLDADALHLLSLSKDWDLLPAQAVLTPHIGEFKRMTGKEYNGSADMLLDAMTWAEEKKCFLVLKGAFTAICTPNGEVYFNTSGHPGMATAGSGDVLTGLLTGLLAQGIPVLKAIRFGVWMHGFAGEEAAGIKGEHAMIASDIIENLQ